MPDFTIGHIAANLFDAIDKASNIRTVSDIVELIDELSADECFSHHETVELARACVNRFVLLNA